MMLLAGKVQTEDRLTLATIPKNNPFQAPTRWEEKSPLYWGFLLFIYTLTLLLFIYVISGKWTNSVVVSCGARARFRMYACCAPNSSDEAYFLVAIPPYTNLPLLQCMPPVSVRPDLYLLLLPSPGYLGSAAWPNNTCFSRVGIRVVYLPFIPLRSQYRFRNEKILQGHSRPSHLQELDLVALYHEALRRYIY
jgi:hypothetical protein